MLESMSVTTILSPEFFGNALNSLGIKESENVDLTKVTISKFLKSSMDDEKTMAKNVVLINSIHKQGFDKISPVSIRNQCPTCHGNGFSLNFFQSVEEKCSVCNGTGWKISQCSKCSGTGKIGESPCFICHGRGTYIYKKTDKYPGKKCLSCMGIGRVKVLKQSDTKIESICECPKCKSTGMYNEVTTPLINSEMAAKLMSKVSQATSESTEISAPPKEKKQRKSKKTEIVVTE